MFDWARGSVLKKMIQEKIPSATYDPWLKGWASAWPLATLKIPKGIKTLDVGPGNNPWYADYFSKLGCKAHVLEQKYIARKDSQGWGISKKTMDQYPHVKFHNGLAGQNIGPKNHFDLITCISVMEHVYDRNHAMDPKNPLPHIDALADMIRMLKPGGVLVLTYDFFLNDMAHWRGWDYLADISLLQLCGIPLLNPQAPLKSRTYIYNYEDTLFMAPEGILSFSGKYMRSTSIGIMFRKPGGPSKIKLSPHPSLKGLILGQFIDQPEQISAVKLKQIMSIKTRQVLKDYVKKIRSSI